MYDSDKVNYKEDEHDEAAHLINVVKAIEHEWVADEDPGEIDFDDVVTLLKNVSGDFVSLIRTILKANGSPARLNKIIELANMAKRHEGWL